MKSIQHKLEITEGGVWYKITSIIQVPDNIINDNLECIVYDQVSREVLTLVRAGVAEI